MKKLLRNELKDLARLCETNLELKSVAPEGTKLENLESRMAWITEAAQQFHNLMQTIPEHIDGELKIMAGWKDMSDDPTLRQRAGDAADQTGKFIQRTRERLGK